MTPPLKSEDVGRSKRTSAEKVVRAALGDSTQNPGSGAPAEYAPSAWDFVAAQVAQYEATEGREGGDIEGVPVVILTTVGRRSGKLRKSPLMRVTDGDSYAAIASMGGAPKDPQWYFNVLAEPNVTLQDRDAVRRYRCHVAEGEERSRWWAKAVEVWPDYDVYPTKTDRHIPLIVLEPLR